jgi:hypothetical protein
VHFGAYCYRLSNRNSTSMAPRTVARNEDGMRKARFVRLRFEMFRRVVVTPSLAILGCCREPEFTPVRRPSRLYPQFKTAEFFQCSLLCKATSEVDTWNNSL